MAEKKQDFVVSDRRRFAPEGELRTDVSVNEEEKEAAAAPAAAQPASPASPAPQAAVPVAPETAAVPPKEAEAEADAEMPPPPTAAEQKAQTDAYQDSGKKLDEIFSKSGGRRESLPEMTFERLVESFYMTALLQMGAIRPEGESPAVDIIGARQTIDSITLLQEKTKGNLTDREQTLLQNVLFELRMAWIEITNALASAKPPAGTPPSKK
jgi:Domain of unknown function (DUF1844)